MNHRSLIGTGLAVALVGCAYYNGLYNANRLADAASKADREGRPGEAQALWAQAAVKAESVVARYPKSKHRDDATLLQGRALQASGQCSRAMAPLLSTITITSEHDLRDVALLTLGQCLLQMEKPDSAVRVLTQVGEGADSANAAEARYWRGRAFMAMGDNEAAVSDLEASASDLGRFALAIAYSRLGRGADAARVLQPQVGKRYPEGVWLATLDSLGAAHPHVTTDLVDRLVARRSLTKGQRARLLLADGRRWSRLHDDRRAKERFAAAAEAAPDSTEGREAVAERFMSRLRLTQNLGEAAAILDSLGSSDQSAIATLPAAAGARRILQRAVANLVPDTSGAAQLAMFLAAEQLRDSLRALPLARSLFIELPMRYPGSVLAPKALLAAVALDPARADSLLEVLRLRYPTAPHALALRGLAAEAFAAIEDSLRGLTVPDGVEGEPGLPPGSGGEPKPRKPIKPGR